MTEWHYEGRELLLGRLQELINETGSLRAAAGELGVSAAFLSMVRKGRKKPGERICNALGIAVEHEVVHRVRYTERKTE